MWAAGKPASSRARRRLASIARLRRKSEGGALETPDPNEPRRGCGCEEPDARLSKQPWRHGATVRTDGWSAYSGLANQGYDHQPRSISASGDPAQIVMRGHGSASRAPLCLIAGGWASTMVPFDADHLDCYLGRVHFPIQIAAVRRLVACFGFRLLQQAVQPSRRPQYKGASRRSSQPRKPNVGGIRDAKSDTQYCYLAQRLWSRPAACWRAARRWPR